MPRIAPRYVVLESLDWIRLMIDQTIYLDAESWDALQAGLNAPQAPTPASIEANRTFHRLLAEGQRLLAEARK